MSPRRHRLRCEEIRPLLPDLAEGALHEAGPAEAHIATCATCSSEFSKYRSLLTAMAELREAVTEPAPQLVDRILLEVAPETQPVRRLHRVASAATNPRVVLSVGGAVVGATAVVGLLWWRAHRGVASAAAAAAAAGPVLATS